MKRKLLISGLIIAVFVLGGLHDALALGAWTSVSPLPVPMGGGLVQCADDADSFYIVSGIMRKNVNARWLFRYDINDDNWVKLKNMPDALRGCATACYDGKIYVAGGTDLKTIFDTLYIYDIDTDEWSSGPPLPDPVAAHKMGVWNGKLYMVGGSRDLGTSLSRVDVYDIASGSWEAGGGADMPFPVFGFGIAEAGPYLYVVGGTSESGNIDKTQRYDMKNDVWEVGPTFTSMRAFAGVAVTDSHLYALGGDIEDGDWVFHSTDLVEVLDLSAWPEGEWVDTGVPLPTQNLYPPTACTEVLGSTGGEIWDVGGGFSATSTYTEVYYLPIDEGCP